MIETHLKLAQIESTIISFIRPSFYSAEIIEETKTMHVIVSHSRFKYIPVVDRIRYIYDTLSKHNVLPLDEYPIIVEVFDDNELEDLLEMIFDENKKRD